MESVKPEKKTLIIEYWTCLIERHRHISKEIAEKCIKKKITSKDRIKAMEFNSALMGQKIILARLRVKTNQEIAKMFETNPTRVGRILDKYAWEIYDFCKTNKISCDEMVRKPKPLSAEYILSMKNHFSDEEIKEILKEREAARFLVLSQVPKNKLKKWEKIVKEYFQSEMT